MICLWVRRLRGLWLLKRFLSCSIFLMGKWEDTTLLLEYQEETSPGTSAGDLFATWPARAIAICLGAILGTVIALKMISDTEREPFGVSAASAKPQKQQEASKDWGTSSASTEEKGRRKKPQTVATAPPEAIAPTETVPTETTPTETTPTETVPTETTPVEDNPTG